MSARIQQMFPLFLTLALGSAAFGQTPTPAQSTMAPIDGKVRLEWLATENLSPAGLLENVAIGAVDTWANSPKEYGPHWIGFAKRTGMVTANYGVKSTMEVGFGSLWGEDPRYDRTEGLRFGGRLAHVVKMTFFARDRAGQPMPAYSRFIAIPGSSFLSNEWLPDSQATVNQAVVRTGLGFLSRMGENAYKEFIARRH